MSLRYESKQLRRLENRNMLGFTAREWRTYLTARDDTYPRRKRWVVACRVARYPFRHLTARPGRIVFDLVRDRYILVRAPGIRNVGAQVFAGQLVAHHRDGASSVDDTIRGLAKLPEAKTERLVLP